MNREERLMEMNLKTLEDRRTIRDMITKCRILREINKLRGTGYLKNGNSGTQLVQDKDKPQGCQEVFSLKVVGKLINL